MKSIEKQLPLCWEKYLLGFKNTHFWAWNDLLAAKVRNKSELNYFQTNIFCSNYKILFLHPVFSLLFALEAVCFLLGKYVFFISD